MADNKSPGFCCFCCMLPILATLPEPLVSPSHWPRRSSDLFFSLSCKFQELCCPHSYLVPFIGISQVRGLDPLTLVFITSSLPRLQANELELCLHHTRGQCPPPSQIHTRVLCPQATWLPLSTPSLQQLRTTQVLLASLLLFFCQLIHHSSLCGSS